MKVGYGPGVMTGYPEADPPSCPMLDFCAAMLGSVLMDKMGWPAAASSFEVRDKARFNTIVACPSPGAKITPPSTLSSSQVACLRRSRLPRCFVLALVASAASCSRHLF